jgi:hypothetical protein
MYCKVKIIKGNLYNYLKDVDLVGRIQDDGEFIMYGCENEDQEKFYKGLLDYDKFTEEMGWETVEDVKEFWEDEADMILCVEKDCYEVLE